MLVFQFFTVHCVLHWCMRQLNLSVKYVGKILNGNSCYVQVWVRDNAVWTVEHCRQNGPWRYGNDKSCETVASLCLCTGNGTNEWQQIRHGCCTRKRWNKSKNSRTALLVSGMQQMSLLQSKWLCFIFQTCRNSCCGFLLLLRCLT